MNSKRLLKLAAFLETVPRHRFDMGSFGHNDKDCGFVACAVGWGSQIPSFKRAGLRVKGTNYSLVTYKGHSGFHAAAVFFDISYEDAQWLFTGGGKIYNNNYNPTPKIVAKGIRKCVSRGSIYE